MKRFLFVLIIGGVGGVLLNNFVLPSFGINFLARSPVQTIIKETETIIKIEPDFWKGIVPKAEKSVAFVQFFSSSGSLISQTNGIILTNDGLVVLPLNAVPKSFSAIQVFADDKILKGSLATNDSTNNLALIEVESSDLPILDFADLKSLVLGQNVLVVGKKIAVNQVQTFAHISLISEISGQIIFLDLQVGQQRGPISGTAAVDSSGKMIGMVQINNQAQAFIMPHAFLRSLLEKYLNQKS